MKAEDLVEALNIHIVQTRKSNNIEAKGHLVLQRNIQENSVFKAYKTYLYTLNTEFSYIFLCNTK